MRPLGALLLALLVACCAEGAGEAFGDLLPEPTLAAELAAPPPREDLLPVLPFATEVGEATYYADALSNQITASGELLDQAAMVAAHRHYPFGTLVRVTNRANRKSVEVRVIDRGPFAEGRHVPAVIDVSQGAARELGMLVPGRAVVTLEVLEWGTPEAN